MDKQKKIIIGTVVALFAAVLVYILYTAKPIEKFQDLIVEQAIIQLFNVKPNAQFSDYVDVVSKYNYPHLANINYYIHFSTNLPLFSGSFKGLDIRAPFKKEVTGYN